VADGSEEASAHTLPRDGRTFCPSSDTILLC